MTKLSPDARRLVHALRAERLSDDDRARLRARVLGGTAVAAAATASVTSAAKATTLASAALNGKTAAVTAGTLAAGPATLATKVATVGLGWKLSSVAVLVLAAAPVVYSVTSAPAADAPALNSKTADQASVLGRASAGAAVPRPQLRAARLVPAPERPPSAAPPVPPQVVLPVHQIGATVVVRAPARVAPAARAKPQDESAASPSTLAAESALIERALAALRDGDLAAADAALARHALLYPNGVLTPERERTRARLHDELSASSESHPATERNIP